MMTNTIAPPEMVKRYRSAPRYVALDSDSTPAFDYELQEYVGSDHYHLHTTDSENALYCGTVWETCQLSDQFSNLPNWIVVP